MLGANEVHVERIIPQKIATKKAKDEFGDWITYLGKDAESQHGKYVSRIGNLTIVAGILNIGASNNPFIRKRKRMRNRAFSSRRNWRQSVLVQIRAGRFSVKGSS